MGGLLSNKYLFILFAAMVILARPVIIYSSGIMQTALYKEIRNYGYLRSVRKRREQINIKETVLENERRTWKVAPLDFTISLLRKWAKFLLYFLSLHFIAFHFLKRRRSVFEVTPQENYILSLSVLRI